MSAKPRFGETVLYNIPKTVTRGKSQPRWNHGVWIGSIETSDEHLIATELGVIKARAVTAVMESKRFDAKSIQNVKGVPWKPSTKHKGYKIRTHIDEDDDERIEGGSDDDDEEEINMEVYLEDDSTETAE